jgi:hypothetical protein
VVRAGSAAELRKWLAGTADFVGELVADKVGDPLAAGGPGL